MILISNDRTSASKKINGMALILTLTAQTAAFERTKEQFSGFRLTVYIVALYAPFINRFSLFGALDSFNMLIFYR